MSNVIPMPRYKLPPEIVNQIANAGGDGAVVALLIEGPDELLRHDMVKNLEEAKGRAQVEVKRSPADGWIQINMTCRLEDLPHIAEHELIGHLFFRKLLANGFIIKNQAFRPN